MDARLRYFASRQDDVIAAWQLLSAGWTRRMIEHRRRQDSWRLIHRGVYITSAGPVRVRQRWIAATLTTPESVLSHDSAAACWGFRPACGSTTSVTRPGSGGSRRFGRLLVQFSPKLGGEVTRRDGIVLTTAARTLIDISPGMVEPALARAFREALRLGVTTIPRLEASLELHPTRGGTSMLRALSRRYATIPYARTRSDAEALALELLHDDGIAQPLVNVRVGGEEADLVFPESRRIIEIDGAQFHRFRDEDARKERAWRSAGFTVHRLPSDAVYDRPRELIRLARGP